MDKLAWYKQAMRKLKKKGLFPWVLPGGEEFGIALIALDEVFDLPDEIKEYMAGSFKNGHPHFMITCDDPGWLYIHLGSMAGPVKYPVGDTEQVTAAMRSGALKRAIMRAWRRGKREGLL